MFFWDTVYIVCGAAVVSGVEAFRADAGLELSGVGGLQALIFE